MKKVIAIYHKNCVDGTTSAAVVLRKFPQARLFPLSHDYKAEDLELLLSILDSETEIYTVDCGIGVQEVLSRGFKVITLDHHIGIKETLDLLAKENTDFTFIFNNNKSGASLAWQYFFPEEELPEMIKLVEDSDLWKGCYGEDAKRVNNYLWLFINDPVKVLQILSDDLKVVKDKGEIISAYVRKEIAEQIEIPAISLKLCDYHLPAYNITTHESACGNILAKRSGQVAIMFTIKNGDVKLSFRSIDGQKPSALDLAKQFGGGGHVLAAGARVSLSDFIAMIDK